MVDGGESPLAQAQTIHSNLSIAALVLSRFADKANERRWFESSIGLQKLRPISLVEERSFSVSRSGLNAEGQVKSRLSHAGLG